ncbi:MAG TPA: S53 family peptidase [Vicinamibacteria bacterium]|nr:S53 family peptidase [Vicinamibacteria bacterium]
MKLKTGCAGLFVLASVVGAAPHGARRGPHPASTFLAIGPQAVPAGLASPNEDLPDQTLFTCQVGLLPGVVCYDPFQIRHAYKIDSLINAGFDGTGRTVVIIDAFQSPTLPDDLDTFDANYGLPDRSTFFTQIAPDGLTPFDPTDGNMVGWSGEITLDVEWAHAIAPGAKVVLVLAKSNEDADLLSATKYAIDHRLGDVISQSFGENESCMDSDLANAQHRLFQAATRKHIALFASSGDEGAALPTCDGTSWVRAASSPASDPLVTAVGGTELHAADYCLTTLGCDPDTNPAPGTYQGEVAWNEFDTDNASTGGGVSVLFRKPFYQDRSVRFRGRGVPDVAYSAAIYHGALVRWDHAWYLFGGTSVGSPQWAALTAIADQKAGTRLGFANGALYEASESWTRYARVFHDIVAGNNSVSETDADGNLVPVRGFKAHPGWDATTGLGSPVAVQVVKVLAEGRFDDDGRRAGDSGPGEHGRFGHQKARPH